MAPHFIPLISLSAALHTAALDKQMILQINNAPVITQAALQAHVEALLSSLFGALERPDNAENEYIMKGALGLRKRCTANNRLSLF
jgi:hypothetical protein